MRTKILLLLSLFSISLIYSQDNRTFKPIYISLDWKLIGYNVGGDSFSYFDAGSGFDSTPDIVADIPISNLTAFDLGLLANFRTGYTTAISTGIAVDNLILQLAKPVEGVAPYGFRVPLMFGITFLDKSSYSNGRRSKFPSGIRISIGGYYGFNNSFAFDDYDDDDNFGLDDIDEETIEDIKNKLRETKGTNFGAILQIGYSVGGIGINLDIKSDITNFNEEVSGDYKRTIAIFGVTLPLVGMNRF